MFVFGAWARKFSSVECRPAAAANGFSRAPAVNRTSSFLPRSTALFRASVRSLLPHITPVVARSNVGPIKIMITSRVAPVDGSIDLVIGDDREGAKQSAVFFATLHERASHG